MGRSAVSFVITPHPKPTPPKGKFAVAITAGNEPTVHVGRQALESAREPLASLTNHYAAAVRPFQWKFTRYNRDTCLLPSAPRYPRVAVPLVDDEANSAAFPKPRGNGLEDIYAATRSRTSNVERIPIAACSILRPRETFNAANSSALAA